MPSRSLLPNSGPARVEPRWPPGARSGERRGTADGLRNALAAEGDRPHLPRRAAATGHGTTGLRGRCSRTCGSRSGHAYQSVNRSSRRSTRRSRSYGARSSPPPRGLFSSRSPAAVDSLGRRCERPAAPSGAPDHPVVPLSSMGPDVTAPGSPPRPAVRAFAEFRRRPAPAPSRRRYSVRARRGRGPRPSGANRAENGLRP